MRKTSKSTALSDEVERMILAFVPPLPYYVQWQSVSHRWKGLLSTLSPRQVDLDAIRATESSRYLALLQRWPKLTSVKMTVDAIVQNATLWQMGLATLVHLEHLALRHTYGKVLQEVFKSCPQLKTLTVLECMDLRLPIVKTPLQLQKFELHAAKLANVSSIVSILRHAPHLTHLVITASNDLTSQALAQLTLSCPEIHQVVLSQCGLMVASQVETFLTRFQGQLTWLDLSHCRDLKHLHRDEERLQFENLEGLVLDNTLIQDCALESVWGPKLQLVSIQNCRCLTDAGLIGFAESNTGSPLKVLEAKNTTITDQTVIAVERHFPNLTHLGIESCRGVSRSIRQRFALQCHQNNNAFERVLIATNAKAYTKDNQVVEFAAKNWKRKPPSLDEDYKPGMRELNHDDDDDGDAERLQRSKRARPATDKGKSKRSR
ncbi:hypothetical protein LEN26_008002 [Aphanomyces euteiches]|nr:hypothetical protein AeMF1_009639 [Aphanomyces euteiches]KAH9130978.1 hypothetical protein LEN26_008002 [Aphanomyces euteiches]KAH9197803.1 hypothetical protein AeNC1_000247 [Aphanomyces euteiches]